MAEHTTHQNSMLERINKKWSWKNIYELLGKTLSVRLCFSYWGMDIIRFSRECCEGLL